MKLNATSPVVSGPLVGTASVDTGPAPQPAPLPEPEARPDYDGLLTPGLTERMAAIEAMEGRRATAAAIVNS